MPRTDLVTLGDSAQLALAVGAVVDLALPWRTHVQTGVTASRAITHTGWATMTSGAEGGEAWTLLVTVVVSLTALAIATRWARRTAAVIAAVATVLLVGSVIANARLDDVRLHGWSRGSDPALRRVSGCTSHCGQPRQPRPVPPSIR
jgi:hypothetical protein